MKNLKDVFNQIQINENSYKPNHRGFDKDDAYELWLKAAERLGIEDVEENVMLQEVFNMFDIDAVMWFIENLDKDHELNLFDEED